MSSATILIVQTCLSQDTQCHKPANVYIWSELQVPHRAHTLKGIVLYFRIIQTAFLSVLFLTGLGMVLYITGDEIRTTAENNPDNDDYDYDDDYNYDYDDDDDNRTVPDWFRLQFAGAIIAAYFWVKL